MQRAFSGLYRGRGDADDAAGGFGFSHQPHGRPRAVEDAIDIHAHDAGPACIRHVNELIGMGVNGVTGADEAAIEQAVAFLAAAPGVTGQVLGV